MTDAHPTSAPGPAPAGGHARPDWIALAVDGPLLELSDDIRTVRDEATFRSLLDHLRPRVAVVAEPPATPDLVEIVAQERRRRARLRVVHLAPEDDIDARLRALRLGFDEALSSAVCAEELLGRLRLLDERARPRASTTVEVGDGVELDLFAHELRRDGRPVHLRPKEFNLLAMLAGHPGRAYTRRQLLDRVWGLDHRGDPRTVDVHVRWLRAKIETDPARPRHLVTLRGVGYRLDPPDRSPSVNEVQTTR
jgi:two-component system, OmpR family, response regulator RegX3